ncbi:MAG: hypothetical protein HQL49_08030 [Gammaproteobacteria bacterium]|nr:hypothetical protein [Gammaproteobacteria bacterium]
MASVTTESFFCPDEVSSEILTIPAPLFNRCRLLLTRSQYRHSFIPVRTMQFLAILDAKEIIFVDNQAYAVREGVGGRMILLAWRFIRGQERKILNDPVPITIVYYHESAREIQKRMIGEFNKALTLFESRRNEQNRHRISQVLPFRTD